MLLAHLKQETRCRSIYCSEVRDFSCFNQGLLGQLTVLALITIYLGRQRNMSMVMGRRIVSELKKIPDLSRRILEQKEEIKK